MNGIYKCGWSLDVVAPFPSSPSSRLRATTQLIHTEASPLLPTQLLYTQYINSSQSFIHLLLPTLLHRKNNFATLLPRHDVTTNNHLSTTPLPRGPSDSKTPNIHPLQPKECSTHNGGPSLRKNARHAEEPEG